VKTLPELAAKALAAGLAPATPAIAVARATHPDERALAGTIADLPARLAAEPSGGPVIVMIGRVFAQYAEDASRAEEHSTRARQ
jgi:uroporphyrin-III C-methyltransferase/precorrin-2 dehydrogenase/sirohydrochlorin ferrochelatase